MNLLSFSLTEWHDASCHISVLLLGAVGQVTVNALHDLSQSDYVVGRPFKKCFHKADSGEREIIGLGHISFSLVLPGKPF